MCDVNWQVYTLYCIAQNAPPPSELGGASNQAMLHLERVKSGVEAAAAVWRGKQVLSL